MRWPANGAVAPVGALALPTKPMWFPSNCSIVVLVVATVDSLLRAFRVCHFNWSFWFFVGAPDGIEKHVEPAAATHLILTATSVMRALPPTTAFQSSGHVAVPVIVSVTGLALGVLVNAVLAWSVALVNEQAMSPTGGMTLGL